MPYIPKVPAACADLDLSLVERTLAKHYGYIPAAARELGVSGPDLNHLTWAKPELLEEAEIEQEVFRHRAFAVLIDDLRSDDPKRRRWAAEKILSSNIARGHPFSPASRRDPVESKRPVSISWIHSELATPPSELIEHDEPHDRRDEPQTAPVAEPEPVAPRLVGTVNGVVKRYKL